MAQAGYLLHNKYKDNVKAKNGRKVMKTFRSRAEYHRGEWLAWENYIARAQKWMLPAKGQPVDPETWESMGIVVLSNNTANAPNKEFYPCALGTQIAKLYWGNFLRRQHHQWSQLRAGVVSGLDFLIVERSGGQGKPIH